MALLPLFAYATEPSLRRHGPRGYHAPQQFKPWLRDEFLFRCVYCLVRERWHPDGDGGFSVEHLRPSSSAPELAVEYENLFYACCRCNAAKRDLEGILNPSTEPFANHLLVTSEGEIHGLTDAGIELIKVCQLDRPRLVEFRRGLFQILDLIQARDDPNQRELASRFFGFPANLPRLRLLRPPEGNTRPSGIELSCYELASRGHLPVTY